MRLLQPLTDDLALHTCEEQDGSLRALSELGGVFIQRIQLNRAPLVANRLERQRLTQIEARIDEMSVTLRTILEKISGLEK